MIKSAPLFFVHLHKCKNYMSENQNIEWKENWRDEYLKAG